MNKFRVTYERDEGGWWIARVHGVQGVHSNGRTIADARRRVREALGLAIGDERATTAKFEDEVELPADARRRVRVTFEVRRKAEASAAKATEWASRTAALLREHYGLSVRDVGDLLGLSYQRVQQLHSGFRPRASGAGTNGRVAAKSKSRVSSRTTVAKGDGHARLRR